MSIVNMDDMLERKLLEELLTLTEIQIFELGEEYKIAKGKHEELTTEINNMHREAEILNKRHSQIERVLGGH